MTTPLDIIQDSLEKLAIYSPGETISGADSERGLQTLIDLVDQWADDSIRLFQLLPITVFVQAGTQTYTVGQGGTVAAVRPARILLGPATASITVASVTSYLDSVSAIEWNAIYNTDQPGPVQSGTPTTVFYDPQSPVGLLSFYPEPDANGVATVQGYYGLSNFPNTSLTPVSLSSPDIVMAPGQRLGLSSNLAMLLHSYFAMGTLTPDVMAQAQQSKTTLTLTNRLSRAMSVRNIQPQTPVAPRQQ